MTENPYTAPVSNTGIIAERNDFKDIPTKKLKNLRNDSHSIRTVTVLILIGVLFLGLGLVSTTVSGAWKMGGPELMVMLVIAAMAMLNLITSIGLIKRSGWGRVLAMVTSGLMLLGFPIGTLIGVLMLIALTRSKELFEPQRLPHKALDAEWKYRKRNKVA